MKTRHAAAAPAPTVRFARHVAAAIVLSASLVAGAVSAAAEEGDRRDFEFRVLLEGKEVGSHSYDIRTDGNRTFVESTARFDITFLFFTAYKYRHSLSSEWSGQCLRSLRAETNANGDTVTVAGEMDGEHFVVTTDGTSERLPRCVANFAYWNPAILDEQKLLNPQTGRFLDVSVEERGEDEIRVDGVEHTANSYRIVARDMRIDLWYASDGGEWLALESLVKGDRVIRYERI